MSSRLKVALTTRLISESYPSGSEWRDAIAHDWFEYLEKQNLAFIVIPNIGARASIYLEGVNGLILTGGGDITDQPECNWNDLPEFRRDVTEFSLLRAAISKKLPVLGVCRGMQQIHRYFGGEISRITPEASHVGKDHELVFSENPKYLPAPLKQFSVNSFHDCQISKVLNTFQSVAQSFDGIVEAIEHKTEKCLGIMWHPERKCLEKYAQEYNSSLVRKYLEKV
jgi:putative glutamine amidotransferase